MEQVSRANSCGFDLRDESDIATQAQTCSAAGPYHLIVDATGALTIIGPVPVLRHFAPLLAPGPCIYAKLSARVGSITDNHKGGWYGYRASKAALNMLLQTAAIELQRKNAQLRVVALQPGTVRSELSHPFSTGVTKLLEPSESVAGMLVALQNLQPRQGAHFIDNHGKEIPW